MIELQLLLLWNALLLWRLPNRNRSERLTQSECAPRIRDAFAQRRTGRAADAESCEKDGDDVKFPLAEKYEIQAIPSMFLVGKDGKVIARDLSEKELEKKLEELLGAEAKKP